MRLLHRLQPEAGGVVDDHVEPTATVDHGSDELGRRSGGGEIALERGRLPSGGPDLGRQLLQSLLPTGDENRVKAPGGEVAAVASPMPELAPVTMATRFSKLHDDTTAVRVAIVGAGRSPAATSPAVPPATRRSHASCERRGEAS